MKPILKSLQIAVLCGCILNLQSIALAQNLGAEISASAQTSSASSTSSTAGTATTIAAIKNDGNMMSSITMIAIGFIATQLFKYKKTGDILLALGGGAAFVGGEIMSTNSFKDIAEDLEVPSGNPDAAQIESLAKLKKSYEEAKKTTNTKKMLQMAAAGAFGVAGVMAIMMKTKEVAAEKATDLALTNVSTSANAAAASAAASCSSSGTNCEVPPIANQVAASAEKIKAQKKVTDAKREGWKPVEQTKAEADAAKKAAEQNLAFTFKMPEKTPSPMLLKTKTALWDATVSLKKENYLLKEAQTETTKSNSTSTETPTQSPGGSNEAAPISIDGELPSGNGTIDDSLLPPRSGNIKFKTLKFISIFSFVLQSAQANTMSLLMAGGGIALGILTKMIKPLGAAIDKFFFAPKNRAIVWGVLAGLSFAASSASGKTIEKLDENIKKIDDILKPMEANAPGTTTPNASSTPTTSWIAPLFMSFMSSAYANTPVKKMPVYRLGNGKEKMSCLNKAGETNCSSLKVYANQMPVFKEMPVSIRTLAIDVLTMSDGLNGTASFSGAPLAAANRLAANQPAIAKTLDIYKENLNRLLAKDNRPQINFKQEEGRALNYFNKETAKVLQINKVSPSQFLASVNPALIREAINAGKTATDLSYSSAELDGDNEVAVEDTNVKVTNTFSQNAYIPRDTSNMGNTQFNDKPLPKKEYDIGSNDINTDKNSSIFDVISSRYIKSYNKLQD